MDAGTIVPVLALLIGGAIVVILLLRIMRPRSRGSADAAAEPPPAPVEEDHDYLDSSHILPGGPAAASDVALRKASEKRK
jgi:hypothetical protein